MLLSSVLFSLPLLAVIAVADQQCYWPDGTNADGYVPCFSGATSHCCTEDSICLSNGYCMFMTQPYSLARGACTTTDWNSAPGCPDPCWNITATRNTGCSIVLYENSDGNIQYCPNSIVANSTDSTGCAEGVDPITLKTGDIITDKALLANASCSGGNINPSQTIAVASSTPSSSSSANHSGSSSSSSSSSNCPAGSSSNDSSKNTAIGAGVGVPLGVIAASALLWGFYERKKRFQALNNPPHQILMQQPYDMNVMDTPRPSPMNYVPQELGAGKDGVNA